MLYGRDAESAALEGLVAGARAGTSGAVVVRGEAGIGKTALLAQLARPAEGMTVLRATGVEPESDLAFASLLQLLRPVAHHAEALPAPQAAALRVALGTGGHGTHDRFLTGLAVLSLLAEVAEGGPVLCLLDDAHWIDGPSGQALLFAARRLTAEGVAMVFAARDEGFPAPGIVELRPARLRREEAAQLLGALDVTPARRERIIRESGGNPLALTEFAADDGPEPGPAAPLTATDRVLAAFRTRIAALPEGARLMLLVAAAGSRADVAHLMQAAAVLGAGPEDLARAEAERLVEVTGDRVAFRHPLIRAAAYGGAPLTRRVAVHRALADTAPTPDGTALHRAAAAIGPDEEAAAGLAALADRARARGGHASAANVYHQAARMSPDPSVRTARLTAAAWSAGQAGLAARSGELAEEAAAGSDDPAALAELAYIRSFSLFERDAVGDAVRLLTDHAADASSPVRGAEMVRTAAFYAWHSGDLQALRDCAARPELHAGECPGNRAVQGLARVAAGDFAGGLPLLAGLLDGVGDGTGDRAGSGAGSGSGARTNAGADGAEARRAGAGGADHHTRAQAVTGGLLLGDDARLRRVAEDGIRLCRQEGVIGPLPFLLSVLGRLQVFAGEHRDALVTVAEATALARDTGLHKRVVQLDHVVARIAAIEGDETRVRSLIRTGPTIDGSHGIAAMILLDLGLGRYEDVLRRTDEAERGGAWHSTACILACADAAEAAVRLGDLDRAGRAARRFAAWAEASGRPWARATALRLEAMRTQDLAVYERAIEAYGEVPGAPRAPRPFERARTELLHGEALRRARRTTEARTQLRAAAETFERLGATPWAERARAELHATGASPASPPTAPASPAASLTHQELQVARLAAAGTSSREIAAQLFLSPRTVEYHLYKAYPKLGVTSRRELAGLDLS
ncbi:ATP-binding protein [Streptomyces peucetius]|uniref:AAA family ATPase n=1 Tax=Streptomyces peucetius TaxID=1950 RepID=A0ABY6IGN9_STRPE|nr:LuxR family transcriptional regulator [Streptomyces peucetius]UYQ65012.1 AAA family ATPase [Streptomyces peucetius]